jgi:hypothetical protein
MPTAAPAAALPLNKRIAAAVQRWQPFLRALHRDLGCIAVGLTFIYALSGLALNHINDWDPNHTLKTVEAQLPDSRPTAPDALAKFALEYLGDNRIPTEVFEHAARNELILTFADGARITVDRQSGRVTGEAQQQRFMLRAMNWLHVQRGKPQWNYIADTYAIVLIVLAITGLFILPRGGRGIFGRGGLMLLAGILIPMAYLVLSGGP